MIRINAISDRVRHPAPMPSKTTILDFLGDQALALPALLDSALAANERAKYVLGIVQMAAGYAQDSRGAAPSLKADREACGIDDSSFDRCIAESDSDGRGNFHLPGLQKLVALLDQSLEAMRAPITLSAGKSAEAADIDRRIGDRLERLKQSRPSFEGDMIDAASIAAMTSGQPSGGDGIHLLVMDLHREINRLRGLLSTEDVAGAKVYGVAAEDRPLIEAFMAGVNRGRPLKFDHPGLDATAARAGNLLLIQNDIGTTDAHVLVIRIEGETLALTHTDVHLQRLRFFQSLLAPAGIVWNELSTERNSALAKGDLFYVARGTATAADPADLARRLDHIGSRLVFLIDWNRARKRLGLLVPNEAAVAILTWAADQNVGHYAFLAMGGERLVYDALEQAVKTPLRYGQPLHEMIGLEAACDYLRFALQTTSDGMRKGRSSTLIFDQLRGELFNHFRSAEQGLLAEAEHHAVIVMQLADSLRAALRRNASEALARNALQAKRLESRADDIVRTTRQTVKRVAGVDLFLRLLVVADDAADALEDAAYLAGLLARIATGWTLPAALFDLADLTAEGAAAYRRALEAARQVRHGGARETMQRFLEAIDGLVGVEHGTDEQQRLVIEALIESDCEGRRLYLAGTIASHLEQAADALLLAGMLLRDHVLGDVMFT